MKKVFRCTVNLEGFKKTITGKQKIWYTDNQLTYCCELIPSLLVWEKTTKYNDYKSYSGYVHKQYVTLID